MAAKSLSRFKTTDLTLASYLISRGHEPQLEKDGELKPDHPSGVWTFASSKSLDGDLGLYSQGLAKVEPKSFYRLLKGIRREMFSFLGIGQS